MCRSTDAGLDRTPGRADIAMVGCHGFSDADGEALNAGLRSPYRILEQPDDLAAPRSTRDAGAGCNVGDHCTEQSTVYTRRRDAAQLRLVPRLPMIRPEEEARLRCVVEATSCRQGSQVYSQGP